MNADGSGQRRLTRNPARDNAPRWSPDGRRIAFDRGGSRPLWVMNPDGSGQRNLTPAARWWSPSIRNGRPTGGSSRSRDAPESGPPDRPTDLRHERRWQRATKAHATWRGSCLVARREKIAFDGGHRWLRDRTPPHGIYVMNADGSERRRLTQRGEFEVLCLVARREDDRLRTRPRRTGGAESLPAS